MIMTSKQKRFLSFLKRIQDKYRTPIQNAIEAQINYYIETKSLDLPKKQLTKVLLGLHMDCAYPMAVQERANIKRAINRKAADAPFNRLEWMVNEYFRKELLTNAVAPITATTRKQIEMVMTQAAVEGWGVDKTVRALRNSDITKNRAELIVRTESTKAANVGKMLGVADMGVAVEKQWISATDIRTRRIPRNQYDHLHMNGKRVPFDAGFVVPSTRSIDLMMYPGDPQGAAGNVCNCRCTVVFVPIRDAVGQVVPLRSTIQGGGVGNAFMQIANAAMSFVITRDLIQDLIADIFAD